MKADEGLLDDKGNVSPFLQTLSIQHIRWSLRRSCFDTLQDCSSGTHLKLQIKAQVWAGLRHVRNFPVILPRVRYDIVDIAIDGVSASSSQTVLSDCPSESAESASSFVHLAALVAAGHVTEAGNMLKQAVAAVLLMLVGETLATEVSF